MAIKQSVAEQLGSNIEREEAAPPVAGPPKMVAKPKMVRIRLEATDRIPPTGQFFGINGVSYMLRAGVEVDVPIGIIDILNNAVESVPVLDPLYGRVIGHTQKLRFPYTRIASKREMAARQVDADEEAVA